MANLHEVDDLIQAHVDFEAQARIPTPQDRAHSNLVNRFSLKGYIYNNLIFEKLEKVKCNLFQTDPINWSEIEVNKNQSMTTDGAEIRLRYAMTKMIQELPTEKIYNDMPSLIKMTPLIYQTIEKKYVQTLEVENEVRNANRYWPNRNKTNAKAPQKKGKKRQVCSSCGHAFVNKSKLKKHVKFVHEESRKPLNIRREGSAAKRISSSFKSVHEKIKPFKCHGCEMVFLAKKNLYRHIATDHERKKITQKTC